MTITLLILIFMSTIFGSIVLKTLEIASKICLVKERERKKKLALLRTAYHTPNITQNNACMSAIVIIINIHK